MRLSIILLIALGMLASSCRPQPADPALTLSPEVLQSTAAPSFTPFVPKTVAPTSIPTATLIPDTPTPTPLSLTTLLFTGVIVPARCVQAAIDDRGNPDYPYEEVKEIVSKADLSNGTLNATISDFPPRTGCVSTYVLVGGADNADVRASGAVDRAVAEARNYVRAAQQKLTRFADSAALQSMLAVAEYVVARSY